MSVFDWVSEVFGVKVAVVIFIFFVSWYLFDDSYRIFGGYGIFVYIIILERCSFSFLGKLLGEGFVVLIFFIVEVFEFYFV